MGAVNCQFLAGKVVFHARFLLETVLHYVTTTMGSICSLEQWDLVKIRAGKWVLQGSVNA